MGTLFGISKLKVATAFPSLEKPMTIKAPIVKKSHKGLKSQLEKDTFVKTTTPVKKAHKPHGR